MFISSLISGRNSTYQGDVYLITDAALYLYFLNFPTYYSGLGHFWEVMVEKRPTGWH